MNAPGRWSARYDQRAAQQADVLRARDLRRLRGHLEGADHSPTAADVGHQRNPRHHPGRGHPHRRRSQLAGDDRARPGRGHPRDDHRGRRFRRHRPHARDVQRPASGQEMNTIIALAYLLAAALFILGLKQLSSPKGARNGNFTAAAGMVVALGATVPLLHFTNAGLIITGIGIAIGALVGTVGARMVRMTAIPQMVALFNGVGGGAAALVAVAELLKFGVHPQFAVLFPSVFSIVIGSISFAGSAVAFAKLQGRMTGAPITYRGQQIVSGVVAAAIVGLAIAILALASVPLTFLPLMVLALILGVAFVLPIGGADMPVVISVLNACTGLAVAASGFTLNNFALIVAGTLVGASRSLLTKLMSDAMGRSLGNVLFGGFGPAHTAAPGPPGAHGRRRRSPSGG